MLNISELAEVLDVLLMSTEGLNVNKLTEFKIFGEKLSQRSVKKVNKFEYSKNLSSNSYLDVS